MGASDCLHSHSHPGGGSSDGEREARHERLTHEAAGRLQSGAKETSRSQLPGVECALEVEVALYSESCF
jgi:hypothetical protein